MSSLEQFITIFQTKYLDDRLLDWKSFNQFFNIHVSRQVKNYIVNNAHDFPVVKKFLFVYFIYTTFLGEQINNLSLDFLKEEVERMSSNHLLTYCLWDVERILSVYPQGLNCIRSFSFRKRINFIREYKNNNSDYLFKLAKCFDDYFSRSISDFSFLKKVPLEKMPSFMEYDLQRRDFGNYYLLDNFTPECLEQIRCLQSKSKNIIFVLPEYSEELFVVGTQLRNCLRMTENVRPMQEGKEIILSLWQKDQLEGLVSIRNRQIFDIRGFNNQSCTFAFEREVRRLLEEAQLIDKYYSWRIRLFDLISKIKAVIKK